MSKNDDHLTIIQGEDRLDERPILLKFRVKGGKDPYPLTTPDVSEIVVHLELEDQTAAKCLEKKLSDADVVIIDEAAGHANLRLTKAETLLLKIEDDQDFTATITKNGEDAKVLFKEKLTVLEDPCL